MEMCKKVRCYNKATKNGYCSIHQFYAGIVERHNAEVAAREEYVLSNGGQIK